MIGSGGKKDGTTDQIYNENKIYDAGSRVSYTYDVTGISSAVVNGVYRTYMKDTRGSVVGYYNVNGERMTQYEYDAFGNRFKGSDPDPFGYCGEYYDSESGNIYLRARYYNSTTGRFISEDPAKDGVNWYVYCSGNPVMLVDPWGLEDIVVAGGAYHSGDGNPYQYEFVDSALKKIADMGGNATLLVANAGWSEDQYNAIVQSASDRGINLLWFSSVDSLVNYINNGGNGGRENDPITSFTVFAHGTDADEYGNFTGKYAITFGLYSDNDFRFYTEDISKINSSAFASGVISTFYACRTGNYFDNGNFALVWANKTGGETYAYAGLNGRSQYSNINGTGLESHGLSITSEQWQQWYNNRGPVDLRPGEAWNYPVASYFTSMCYFAPWLDNPDPQPGPAPRQEEK